MEIEKLLYIAKSCFIFLRIFSTLAKPQGDDFNGFQSSSHRPPLTRLSLSSFWIFSFHKRRCLKVRTPQNPTFHLFHIHGYNYLQTYCFASLSVFRQDDESYFMATGGQGSSMIDVEDLAKARSLQALVAGSKVVVNKASKSTSKSTSTKSKKNGPNGCIEWN